MYFDTLNSEEQISQLIKPIIEVLQEAGGQLDRSEIRDRISEKDERIAEFEQKIYTSNKTGNQYKKFDFKFNFAIKELGYVGVLSYEKYNPTMSFEERTLSEKEIISLFELKRTILMILSQRIYSINQEKYLRRFLDDGEIPIDNNAAEQSIRSFCIGKKNWVMCDTINGAKSSAIIYSLVETAKANKLRLYEYFNYLLTEIPEHMDDKNNDFCEKLLPWSAELPAECRK